MTASDPKPCFRSVSCTALETSSFVSCSKQAASVLAANASLSAANSPFALSRESFPEGSENNLAAIRSPECPR